MAYLSQKKSVLQGDTYVYCNITDCNLLQLDCEEGMNRSEIYLSKNERKSKRLPARPPPGTPTGSNPKQSVRLSSFLP